MSLGIRMLRDYVRECLRIRREFPAECRPLELARYFPAWRDALCSGATAFDRERPWITFAALAYIEQLTRPSMRVFEYGSGGSTLYWARRVSEVTSIEHDPAWFAQVTAAIDRRHASNCTLQLVEPTLDHALEGADPSDPDRYASSDESLRGRSFRAYAEAIDRFPDNSFDLVLIDGRARPSCIKHARNKVRPGGHLVLDNAERAHYAAASSGLVAPEWKKRCFVGPGPFAHGFWRTCSWQRAGESGEGSTTRHGAGPS